MSDYELERKFLVSDPSVVDGRVGSEVVQVYPIIGADYSVRIRIRSERLILSVKSRAVGSSRHELESSLELAPDQGSDLVAAMKLSGRCIVKHRFVVEEPVTAALGEWTVDRFEKPRAGLVLAEFELSDAVVDSMGVEAAQDVLASVVPAWFCGDEVTNDPAFRNETIAKGPRG